MGGDAFTKIEKTGGGRGLRESSWTPDRLRVNQVAPGTLRAGKLREHWRCLGSAVRWGLELDFRVIQKVGGLEASGFCLPETGRELKRAM